MVLGEPEVNKAKSHHETSKLGHTGNDYLIYSTTRIQRRSKEETLS